MDYFANNRFFEIVYGEETFEFLEFIRIDYICEVTYITLKNVITREIFTFDEGKIQVIRKKFHRFPQNTAKNNNNLAAKGTYSLYY